jgi:AraC family transcriptional regulator
VQLAYAGGMTDATIHQIGSSFRMLLDQGAQPTDRLFVDGMRTALAAHLLGKYTADKWQPAVRAPSFDHKRLKRVLDFVEARLSSDISLDDLAAEACLSPFHFARLFRLATGLTPHRYVTDRRIQVAKEKLALGQSSLVEIALDMGFGSQANFNRVFRKMTGQTPGQYRALGAR